MSIITQLESRIDSMQARIDALMLEHCPERMTRAQLETWAAAQRRVEGPK